MARRRVAAGLVYLLHDDACLGESNAQPAVLSGDQRGKETFLGHPIDELLGIPAVPVCFPPVRVGKEGAKGPGLFPKLLNSGLD